jgi:CheY-like chemotaxis protein
MTYSDKTILIVDDDTILRSTLRKIIHKRMGVTVVEAGNPKEAFEMLKTLRPDAIILDIQMPYMNGLTVMEHLRRIPATRNIPVLACTGLTHKNIISELLKMNINDIIAKPFNSDTVVDKLRLILEEYSDGSKEVPNEVPAE